MAMPQTSNARSHSVENLPNGTLDGEAYTAYSPDFNPIERLWQHLKSHYLAGFLTKQGSELSDKLFDSLRLLLHQPEVLRSVCNTHHS